VLVHLGAVQYAQSAVTGTTGYYKDSQDREGQAGEKPWGGCVGDHSNSMRSIPIPRPNPQHKGGNWAGESTPRATVTRHHPPTSLGGVWSSHHGLPAASHLDKDGRCQTTRPSRGRHDGTSGISPGLVHDPVHEAMTKAFPRVIESTTGPFRASYPASLYVVWSSCGATRYEQGWVKAGKTAPNTV
jgi:hypothetical protein